RAQPVKTGCQCRLVKAMGADTRGEASFYFL
ncbi:MAG: hypothetical protein ACI82H_000568, partial [Alphaproteobacteria bacterium]